MGNETPQDNESKRKQLQEVNGVSHKRPKTTKEFDRKGLILKMNFPNFEQNSVYSVDVHPDGTRFAAGGVGDESAGRIVIWQIISMKGDRPEVRVISQMDNHSVCTNCVRWSHKGNYLASGANDNLVMIWQPVLGKDSENWRCAHVLRSHSGDVFSVAWSPNDTMLASCSVDNTVVIWNSEKSFQLLTVLRDSQSLVKGVTWDPIGKFLAAQDDKSLRIWRTSDWKQEQILVDHFDKGDSCTQVLRLDWSTDGMNIISAHASNEGRPVAQIVERNDNWKSPFYLAGHSRPIVCVRFNPRMFVANAQENSPYCVCATGGRDHNLTVWNFKHRRPHSFVGLFRSPVMDISWFPDGMSLLACSMDGTVALVRCGPDILGTAITKDQQAQTLTKLYGKVGVESAQSFVGSHNIVESSVFLDAQEAESQRRKDNGDRSVADSVQDNVVRLPYEGIPLDKQIETVLPSGRRKITPIFIPEIPIRNIAVVPGSGSSGSDDRSQSSSVPHEAFKNPDEPPVVPTVNMARPLAPAPLRATIRNVPPVKKSEPSEKMAKPSSTEKKKKIEKSAFVEPKPSAPVTKPVFKKPKRTAQEMKIPEPSSSRQENETEPESELVRAPLLNGVMKKTKTYPAKTIHVNEPSISSAKEISILSVPKMLKDVQRPEAPRRTVSSSVRRIAAPSALPVIQVSIHTTNEAVGNAQVVFSAENDLPLSYSGSPSSVARFHKIQFLVGTQTAWVQYVFSPVTLVAADSTVACSISEDLSMSIWCSESGARLHECFLPSSGCFLACSTNSLFVVTVDGKVLLWKRAHKFETWKRQDLGSIEGMLRTPSGSCNILQVSFAETEIPVISMSDHRHFICDTSNFTWVIAHDENVRFGNYVLSTAGVQHNVPETRGPLSKLQKSRSMVAVGSHVTPEIARIMALGFMEKQMFLARILKSPGEYQGWLKCYAQSLVDFECLPRLRTVLDSLMGPPGTIDDIASTPWEPEVLGFSKRGLLEKILPVLGRKTQFQRVYTEYKQRLELFSRNIFATDR